MTTAFVSRPLEMGPTRCSAITPSDSTDVSLIANYGIRVTSVSGGSTLSFKLLNDSTAVTVTVYPGDFFHGQFSRIMATTTATVIAFGL